MRNPDIFMFLQFDPYPGGGRAPVFLLIFFLVDENYGCIPRIRYIGWLQVAYNVFGWVSGMDGAGNICFPMESIKVCDI